MTCGLKWKGRRREGREGGRREGGRERGREEGRWEGGREEGISFSKEVLRFSPDFIAAFT